MSCAELRRVQEQYRHTRGMEQQLPVYHGLEYPVDLRRGHPLGALVRDLQDQLEELGHPLAGLGRQVQERDEPQERRPLLELALARAAVFVSFSSIRSHLFTATMIAAPRSHASLAIFRSWTCMPSFASTTRTQTSARSIARAVRSVE